MHPRVRLWLIWAISAMQLNLTNRSLTVTAHIGDNEPRP
jgi:hypothetical protein